jgi:hypothetical protein
MGFIGDLSGLKNLAELVASMASIPSRISRRVSEELVPLIEKQFEDGVDPYGNAWEPLSEATVSKGRSPPPLTETGAMRDSLSIKPLQSSGISVTLDHPALPHQTGWQGSQGTGPARPILPINGELPPEWGAMIERITSEEMRKK